MASHNRRFVPSGGLLYLVSLFFKALVGSRCHGNRSIEGLIFLLVLVEFLDYLKKVSGLKSVHLRVLIATTCTLVVVWASAPCALQYLLDPAPVNLVGQTQAGDSAVMKATCVCSAHYATGTRPSTSGQALLPAVSISSQPYVETYVLLSARSPLLFEEVLRRPDVPVPRLPSPLIG